MTLLVLHTDLLKLVACDPISLYMIFRTCRAMKNKLQSHIDPSVKHTKHFATLVVRYGPHCWLERYMHIFKRQLNDKLLSGLYSCADNLKSIRILHSADIPLCEDTLFQWIRNGMLAALDIIVSSRRVILLRVNSNHGTSRYISSSHAVTEIISYSISSDSLEVFKHFMFRCSRRDVLSMCSISRRDDLLRIYNAK